MFFHLQYIHLFRPFLRYAPKASPLPPHISPRRICTANAGAISKLMRLYKKTYNLRQICNIAVYMLHSACTIHLLNLPEKTARRDIIHGVKHLEEIAEDWLCGRRTLSIISVLSRKWMIELPDEAAQVLQKTDERWGTFNTSDVPSPRSHTTVTSTSTITSTSPQQERELQAHSPPSYTASPPLAQSPPTISKTMSPEGLANATLSPPAFQPRTQVAGQMANNAAVVGSSVVDYSTLNSPHWQPPYSQPYVPFPTSSPARESSQGVSAQAAVQPTAQSSVFVIDGHEWYLKDGVNWQAGFNAWNMGNASYPPATIPDQQSFLFTPSGHSPANPISPSQFPPDVNFDSLDALSSIDGWDLSNLE